MMHDKLQSIMTTAKQPRERLAGLRFAQLIRQLLDDGWTMTAISEAIGCDVGLISKTFQLLGELSSGVVQKGLRDDVIQGIHEGLRVQANYLFMQVPKGYPNRVRLSTGATRQCDKHELDHKDFRVVTNVELEIARDKKERAEMRSEQADMRNRLDDLSSKFERLLAHLGADQQRSVR